MGTILPHNWEGPVSFIAKTKLIGTTTKAHARHLYHAKLDELEIPQNLGGRTIRQTGYVVPPENVSEEEQSDEEEETALQRLVSQTRVERDNSDEEDILLQELRRRIRAHASNNHADNETTPKMTKLLWNI